LLTNAAMNTNDAWVLVGPTAVGKTAVAQYVAEATGATIISADSMLVYRGMDIGTAKPNSEQRGGVRYLGIDLVNPDESFTTGAWLQALRTQCAACARGDSPNVETPKSDLPKASDFLVVGGTGLYIRALTSGLNAVASDPQARRLWQDRLAREGLESLRQELARRAPDVAAKLADPENPRRVIRALEHLDAGGAFPENWQDLPQPRIAGLRMPRPILHARIAARVEQMFANGLINEVRALRAQFSSWAAQAQTGAKTMTARQAIGYAEVCDLLDGKLSPAQAKAQIVTRTRQLAKRQETWFRHQADVAWVDVEPDEPVSSVAARVLAIWREYGPTPVRLRE